MRLSSLSDYAVVLLSAAVRLDAGGTRLTATMLAVETGVPLPTAQKLMGRLAAAGLFRSGRGTGGGFTLARSAAEISLADIVEAVEGPIALTSCVEGGGKGPCQIHDDCRVRPQMDAVNGAVRGALSGVTLASLSGVH